MIFIAICSNWFLLFYNTLFCRRNKNIPSVVDDIYKSNIMISMTVAAKPVNSHYFRATTPIFFENGSKGKLTTNLV